MLDKLLKVFEENGVYVDFADLNADLDMDSIQYVSLIVDLERVFNINFPDEYLGDKIPKSFGEFVDVVTSILGNDDYASQEV